MQNAEYLRKARRDFLTAGKKGHYKCPASQAIGVKGGRMCVAVRACATDHKANHFAWLTEEWERVLGESMPETNARGYAACVAAYDQLILQTTTKPKKEIVPA